MTQTIASFPNLDRILLACSGGLITKQQLELVRCMVKAVSCSGNKDSVPEEFAGKEWFLYSDRLEALGVEEARRTYVYIKGKGLRFLPLRLGESLLPRNWRLQTDMKTTRESRPA